MKRGARVAAALCLAANACAASALTPAEVYALVSPSVWRVVTYDVDGLPLSQGSAVVVGPEALATNCHVLAKAKRVVVRHEQTSFDAKLELWDTPRDVCQLRAAGLTAAPVRIAPTASVVVGENVYAIGTPRGLELTMSAGLVSSLRARLGLHVVGIGRIEQPRAAALRRQRAGDEVRLAGGRRERPAHAARRLVGMRDEEVEGRRAAGLDVGRLRRLQ